jgi:predicted Fe-Mo cluster-binding NifX family protein
MNKLIVAGLAVSVLMMSVFVLAGEGKTERIAVAANGQTPASTVGKQPGRSPFFLLFDKKGAFVQAIENPHKDQAGGGISVIQFLSGKGVTTLVAEGFGPRIVEIMQGKGIRPVAFTGVAEEAVRTVVQAR